ncbi:MAG TPA: preprotein translocase subunit SecE [candidate division CPR3 bacterium]|uniref:Protein translocase subunit SecE n=1 Tax=candidate division CPR3 bacterium TaxID=2268181 RepID=A0A7C1T7F8_UNCC3|nr:preprotein translocase subunit SecE [Patescibacteria group bacterium]HEB13602.1 preprotein translocase subunit SecE [candidate division CPR3 bacterium]
MRLFTFLKEVHLEMKRVNWPTQKEVLQNTMLVLAISIAVAIFLGMMDFIFVSLLERFIIR